MGLWFGAVVIFSVFTSMYFMYGSDRMAMFRDPKITVAEIMKKCHDAGVAEARSTTIGVSGIETRSCAYDVSGTTGLMNSFAAGLTVSNVVILFAPGSAADPTLTGTERIIVTYLTPGSTVNGVAFNEVAGQVGERYYGDPEVGLVIQDASPTVSYIGSVSAIKTLVPHPQVPVGSIAMVTIISS